MCSPGLNVSRASVCFYEMLSYISYHLPYIPGNVSVPNNLPFFWLGHYASEVYKSDNLHLNISGAKAFGKQILNAFTGDNQVMNYTVTIGTTSLHAQVNSMGNITIHGNYVSSSTSDTTLESSTKITEYQKIFSKFNGGAIFKGISAGATSHAWVNITNDIVLAKTQGTGAYYF